MTPMEAPTPQAQVRTTLAAAYASGALDPGFRLLMDAQAALVDAVARDLASADALVGALFEAEAPVALRPDALESVFAAIAASKPQYAPPRANLRSADPELAKLPDIISGLAATAERTSGWKFASFGIRSLTLDIASDTRVELLRIEPGAAAPRHDHGGVELTLVLQGAFRDERGVYETGDIAVAGPGDTHRPVGEPGELCFALAVSEAPPRLQGALGLAQRLLKQ